MQLDFDRTSWVGLQLHNIHTLWFIFFCEGMNDKTVTLVTALIINVSTHPVLGFLFHSETQLLRT